jgi:hypothetical protein
MIIGYELLEQNDKNNVKLQQNNPFAASGLFRRTDTRF